MNFNEDQIRAINHTGSGALILAGPGSGKTELLVEKFARTVEAGAHPESIMAVTFTNKAAAEMRARLKERLKLSHVNNLWLGTFHSISNRILNNHLEMIDCPDGISVLDDKEPKLVMERAMRHLDLYINEKDVVAKVKKLDELKNSGVDVSAIKYEAGAPITHEANINRVYQQILNQMHCFDFGDLIVRTTTLMNEYGVIRKAWQKHFKLIMIDEYQDSNASQRIWAKCFVNPVELNLFAVADDDQSIYRFRGADPRVISNFEKHWPGSKKIILRMNYRNPPQIIQAAGRLIALNDNRNEKNIIPNSNKGGGIKVLECRSERSFYDHIAALVLQRNSINIPLSTNMVMTRTNKQAEEISEALENRGVKAFLAKAPTEGDPTNILTHYLRYITNNADKLALYGILRAYGYKTPLDPTFQNDEDAKKLYQEYKDKIDDIVRMREILSPREIIDYIVDQEGLMESADTSGGQIQIRFHHLYASLMLATQETNRLYDIATIAKSNLSEGFLVPEAVIVSTMHGVKGLQAKTIFAVNWTKGEFPFPSRVKDDINESRRLAYMTVTRASENCYIYYNQAKGPSQFITEMGLSASEII